MMEWQVSGLTNRMIPSPPRTFEDLARLCGIFSDLDLFLWLQNKFPPGNYIEQQNALALKETAIRMIGEALEKTGKLRLKHCYVTRDKEVRSIWKKREGKPERNEIVESDFYDGFSREDESKEDRDWNRMVEPA